MYWIYFLGIDHFESHYFFTDSPGGYFQVYSLIVRLQIRLQIEAAIYVLLPLSVALTAATIPLAIELSVEICFPAPEATASGWITLWC
jgi:hypothetical protein